VKEAYSFVAKAYSEDKIIDPASITSDQANLATVFCNGDTAFFLQGWAGVYAQANDASTSKVAGQVEVAPYSIGKTPEDAAVLSLPEAMAIPTTSKNKDAAWKYIEFMSSRDFDKEKALAIGALPIYSDLFEDKEILAKYPYWENFGKQSANAKGHQPILWHDQFSSAVQTESLKILLEQESVDDGLANLQKQLEAVEQDN